MATDRTSRHWKRPDQSGKEEARALGALCSTVAPVSMQTPWLVCSGLSAWWASLPSHSWSLACREVGVACRCSVACLLALSRLMVCTHVCAPPSCWAELAQDLRLASISRYT